MTLVRFTSGLILLLAACSCREEHPFHDSSEWNLNESVTQLVDILEAQNGFLKQLHAATPIPPSIAMGLWSLSIDEHEIGFECWARLARSPELIPEFCQAMVARASPLEQARNTLISRYSDHPVFFLQSIAPGHEALNSIGPRLQAYGVTALLERCGSPNGYRQRHWP